MGKRYCSALRVLAFVLLSGCSLWSGKPRQDEKIVLRLAVSMPEAHPSAKASSRFAETVTERSGGRIEIRVQYGGVLGDEREALEQLRFGGISFAQINLLTLAGEISGLEKYLAPYTYETPDDVILAIGDDAAIIDQALGLELIALLAALYPDQRCIASRSHAVRSVADLKRRRIRTLSTAVLGAMFTELGAQPAMIRENEMPSSIASGYVDCSEMGVLEYDRGNYNQIMPYVTFYSAIFSPDLLLASSASIGRLDSGDQKLIRECAREIYDVHKEDMIAARTEVLNRLEIPGSRVSTGVGLDSEIRGAYAGRKRENSVR